MKILLPLFLVVCGHFVSHNMLAQSFYETQFQSGDLMYDVLMIYYDDNDILVRTRYGEGENYRVAEFDAYAEILTLEDGSSVYMFDGENARIVYGKETNYSADNYLFYQNERGEWTMPYVIDDNGLAADDPVSYMGLVNYWNEIDPATTFTEEYVYNFFNKDEPMYNLLLSYNPSNLTGGNDNSISDGQWKVIMSKGTGYGLQTWVTRYDFPGPAIKENWDKGKSITDLSYGNGLWMVTMSENSGYGTQAYKYGASWPDEWIEEHWEKGRRITEVSYGDGQWALVTSKNSGYSDQQYIVSKTWPKAWLDEQWKNGTYSITSIAYGAEHWVVVLSNIPGKNPGQTIKTGAEFPASKVEAAWKEGYDITNMAYGDEWIVVLTKGEELFQSYDGSSTFPKDFVDTKWSEGYSISEAIYTYKESTSGNIVLNFTGTASTGGGSNNTIVHTNNTNTNTSNTMPVPRIHLVVAANTKVPDIGASCASDRDNIVDEFSDISNGLGIQLIKSIVDGENLSKSNVVNAINNLNVKPNDIIVFAYSGHGYRWTDQVSKYPMMALFYSRYDSPSNNNSLNLKDAYDLILAKGARLNIVLGDCCNSSIGVTSRNGAGSLATRSYSAGSTKRLRELFFNSNGNIIAAAAQVNETACGGSAGGYFLNAFFSALDKEVSYIETSNPSWQNIFERTMSTATYKTQNLGGCDVQHGVYKSTVYAN